MKKDSYWIEIETTIEQVRNAIRNAAELISEARLLVDHGRFARGFTLTHIATEETAKALALIAYLIDMTLKNKSIDHKSLKRALQNHKFKIAIANWFDDIMTGAPDGAEKDRAWRKLLVKHNLYNEMKNDSLYVGVDKVSFPSDKFGTEDGSKIVEAYLSISESRMRIATEMSEDTLKKILARTVHDRDAELESKNYISVRHAVQAFVTVLLNTKKFK